MKYIGRLFFIFSSLAISLPSFSAQTCNDHILASTPDSAFTVNDDGTVTHTATGLMWKICSEGQSWNNGSCLSTPTTYDWQLALQVPATLNTGGGYAGYTNWRLPNIKELMSILEVKCQDPTINLNIFNASSSSNYWTSTLKARGFTDTFAWRVFLGSGVLEGGSRNSSSSLVRLVRNGS